MFSIPIPKRNGILTLIELYILLKLKLKNIVISLSYSIIKLYTDNRKIIQFEEITDFKIKQWTNESLHTNDYFFVPNEKKDLVLKFLNSQL